MKINLTNPKFKVLFLNCDSSISHCNSKIMQVFAKTPRSILERVIIIDHERITNTVSYKYLRSDLLKNKAIYEATKYKILYNKLNVGYSTKKLDKIDFEDVVNFFDIDTHLVKHSNIILVTCSTTDINIVEQVKDITNSNYFGTFIHIHVEVGSYEEGGAIYTAMSKSGDVIQPYTSDFEYLETGDLNSKRMLSQSEFVGAIASLTIANPIRFDYLEPPVKRININTMSCGWDEKNITNTNAIKLLKPKKVYKKKGRKKKSKKTSDKFHFILIGTGASGSFFLSDVLQQLSQNHKKVGKIVLCDGDIVEEKNLVNQRCIEDEVDEYKAKVYAERYNFIFPNLNIKHHCSYIFDLSEETIKDLLELDTLEDTNLVIISKVDQHASRKVIHKGFCEINSPRNSIYIDSGNGTIDREGQTVVGYKQKHKVILEPVATFSQDTSILDNDEDIQKLFSCTQLSTTHPQNITTNILSGRTAANYTDKILLDEEIPTHYTLFSLEPVSMRSMSIRLQQKTTD